MSNEDEGDHRVVSVSAKDKMTRSCQLDQQFQASIITTSGIIGRRFSPRHKEVSVGLLVRRCRMTTVMIAIIPLILLAHFVHPIGCDGISAVGSSSTPRRLDLCSSCVGDNSTCRVVSGIFTRPQLNVGYNMVAHIPRGACSLNITEIRKSPNHLALRRKDGSFVFNGDWRLSWSGEYESAGTTFQYSRQDLKILESITSLGPIQEPIDLMVLYQQPNPGIKYEYMLPFTETPIPPVPLVQDRSRGGTLVHHLRQPAAATSRPASYVPSGTQQQQPSVLGSVNPFNAISSFPSGVQGPPGSAGIVPPTGATGVGSSGAILYPGDSSTGFNVPPNGHKYQAQIGGGVVATTSHHQQQHHHLHNHQGRRRNHAGDHQRSQSSFAGVANGKQPIPPGVISGEKKFYWKITGYTNCTEPCGGGMQRSIIRCVRNPTGNPVSDRRCVLEEKPPGQTIRCNLKPCPAEWVIGDWSSCSSECGEGFKTRLIHCQQRISPTLTMRVAEGACLQQRPEIRSICQLRPCNHWETSEWSQCSARCGNGIRKRTVTCVGSNGQRLSLEECDEPEKPAQLTPCNMGPCEGVDWFVSEWSTECSQRCGGGIQTRHVVCSGLQSSLQHHHQGKSSKQFYSHQNHHNPHQYQNLSQYAYLMNKARKSSSSELETNLIEEDDDLPLDPSSGGDGTGGSHVDDGESQLHSSDSLFQHQQQQFFCDESRKPSEERECFSDRSCGDPVWFTGDWGECSVSCGNGIRTRQVLCVLFNRGKFKVATEGLCPTEAKPEEKETCESTRKCPPRWFTTDWNECTALCGGGLQKRSVSCRASNWTLSSSLCSDKDRPIERRSCNEHKCTLTPAGVPSISQLPSGNELSGMVKDKPVLLQSISGGFGGSDSIFLAGTVLNQNASHRYYHQSTNNGTVGNNNRGQLASSVSSPHSSSGTNRGSLSHQHHHNELNEEAEETECTDQYRNCALVVQARLCRYKYYRSVCCNSCSDAIL